MLKIRTMGQTYNITDLEKITGIKSHTIRIWEKRYNLLNPKRTPTNIRYYDEQDLKKLLMVVILYRNGMRISEIASLPLHRLQELVLSFKLPESAQSPVIEQLLLGVTDFNQNFLDQILVKEVINRGIEPAFEKVFFPFLQKVGLLWLTDVLSCLHLNFAHNQISRFLWQNLKFQNIHNSECYLTFVPDNSLVKPLIIYFSFLLNKFGKSTVFLGQVYNVYDIVKTDKFRDCSLLTVYRRMNVDFYAPLQQAENRLVIVDLYRELENFEAKNLVVIHSFDEFREMIKHNF